MEKLITISKQIAAREDAVYPQLVPRIIWQTLKSNQVPQVIKEKYIDSWIDLNPEYTYQFFNDDDIRDFIRSTYPDFLEAFERIKYGASKADLWRYLILYEFGGVYADIDCICVRPLKEWVNPTSSFITQLGINRDICQWMVITTPGNPIFLEAARLARNQILSGKSVIQYNGFKLSEKGELEICHNESPIRVSHKILGVTGPPVLQFAAEQELKNAQHQLLFQNIQIVCVSNNKVSCQMAGNVIHDTGDSDYLRALNRMKTPHYNNFIARLKRRLFHPDK